MPQGTQHAAAAFFPTRFGRNTCAPLLSLCWFQSSGPSLLRCAALAPLGRNVLLGVLCLLVLQKFIGSQGLGILEAWYFEGTMGDGVHFHVGVFLGALDPPKWDEAFLLFGIISPSGILLPCIDSWPAWSWMLKFLRGQPQTLITHVMPQGFGVMPNGTNTGKALNFSRKSMNGNVSPPA